jgi:uncharacterized protein (DUF58 family)
VIFPTRAALSLVMAWCALALAAVFAPALELVLWLAAAGGLTAALVDAIVTMRIAVPQISRRLPTFALQDAPCSLELEISNRAPGALVIEVEDELPRDLTRADPHFGPLALAAGERLQLEVEVVPKRRGDRLLGAPLLLVRSPLGLWRRRVMGPAGASLSVRPDTSKLLRRETLDPKRMLAMLGVKPARLRGQGSEFDSLREYVPGDDPRHIDWPATARRGKSITRLHRHERSHTVVIALDASRLMASPSPARGPDDAGHPVDRRKIDHAVEAALALAYTALVHGDRVGLVVFDDRVRGMLAPRGRRSALGPLVEFLRHVEPRRVEADHAELVRVLSTKQRQRALVIVLTDFVEAEAERFSTPLGVLARRHRALLVALRDPIYAELDPRARWRSPTRGRGLHGLHRRIAIDDLLVERETALAALRRQGAQTLDLPPDQITAPVLNRYLALRYGEDR